MSMDEDYEPSWEHGEDMTETKPTGEGIKVEIGQHALERIEAAAAAGVRQALAARLDAIINETIADIVGATLDEVVGKLAEEAVLNYLKKPRARTNAYGEPMSGTSITIADQIPEKVEKYLTQRVNAKGEADSYGSRNELTRIDWMVGKLVRDELDVATKAAASQVTEKAKQVVAAHVGRFVAEQMIPQIELAKGS